MNECKFSDLLNKNGNYNTPADMRYSPFSNMDIMFYLGLGAIIRRGAAHLSRDFSPANWKIYSYQLLSLVESCRGMIHISGIDNLRKSNPPYVYVANHMSLLETFIIPVLILDISDVAIILKEDLMKYPVFVKLLKALKPILVTRKNPKEDLQTVLKEGARVLQEEKRSILVFPQSTRTANFNPNDFNTLGIKLAQRNNVPCVPIAVKTDFLMPGRIVRDIGRIDRSQPIHLKIGEPTAVTKENSRQIHEDIINFISSSLNEWNKNPDPAADQPS